MASAKTSRNTPPNPRSRITWVAKVTSESVTEATTAIMRCRSIGRPRMCAYAPPDPVGDLAVAPPLASAGGDRRGAGRRCLLPRLPPAFRPGGPEALRRSLPDDAAVGDPGGGRGLRAVRHVRQALALLDAARLPRDPAGGVRRHRRGDGGDRAVPPGHGGLRLRPRGRQPAVGGLGVVLPADARGG